MLTQIRSTRPVPTQSGPPLVDRQARQVRYLRLSLTDRCNYRCTYCMPSQGIEHRPRAEMLTHEELVAVCRAFAAWGVERVRLTGGEPTVRRGLVELVRSLRAIEVRGGGLLEVVMTTNGERLAELAAPLADAGLSGLTVSVDSFDPERFLRITRRGDLSKVLAGIDAAIQHGLAPKLNTVAIRGFNDDELPGIARYAWDRGLVPRFIEVMPMSGGALFIPGELLPAATIRAMMGDAFAAEIVQDSGNGVRGLGPATYWRVDGGPYAGRSFGLIAAMTENFCASCNRLRLSATGQLHACLARDESGDLRAALRHGGAGALEAAVRRLLSEKEDGHRFALDGSGGPTKAMISIGG